MLQRNFTRMVELFLLGWVRMVQLISDWNKKEELITGDKEELITGDKEDGFLWSISTTQPSNYIVKIESFSLVAKNDIETYNSGEFEAGGQKWKLVIHPKGNKKKNIDDHISIYLMMVVDEKCSAIEVQATFRFFLFDHNNDNYLVVQDTVRRFHGLKPEWGIDRLVSLKVFENPVNGYLLDDKCAIGAEVYVCQKGATEKVECLSMKEDPVSYTHTWRIENFSTLTNMHTESTTFTAGGQKWRIWLYPKGVTSVGGTHLTLFLYLADITNLPPGFQIYAEYTLRILDQNYCADSSSKAKSSKSWNAKHWFHALDTNWGRLRFISLKDLNSQEEGYLKNNTCIVEAEVTVHGVTKAL